MAKIGMREIQINITLTKKEEEALIKLAELEYRDPVNQVACMISQMLELQLAQVKPDEAQIVKKLHLVKDGEYIQNPKTGLTGMATSEYAIDLDRRYRKIELVEDKNKCSGPPIWLLEDTEVIILPEKNIAPVKITPPAFVPEPILDMKTVMDRGDKPTVRPVRPIPHSMTQAKENHKTAGKSPKTKKRSQVSRLPSCSDYSDHKPWPPVGINSQIIAAVKDAGGQDVTYLFNDCNKVMRVMENQLTKDETHQLDEILNRLMYA